MPKPLISPDCARPGCQRNESEYSCAKFFRPCRSCALNFGTKHRSVMRRISHNRIVETGAMSRFYDFCRAGPCARAVCDTPNYHVDGRPPKTSGLVNCWWLLLSSGVMGARHMTRAATRAPRRALPRRRALCTNSKKPRYSGSFSCEMPRCGRSQERSKDHVPSIVLTWISQKPSPSSSRAYSPRAWQTVLLDSPRPADVRRCRTHRCGYGYPWPRRPR